jgi:hypothetical protein
MTLLYLSQITAGKRLKNTKKKPKRLMVALNNSLIPYLTPSKFLVQGNGGPLKQKSPSRPGRISRRRSRAFVMLGATFFVEKSGRGKSAVFELSVVRANPGARGPEFR